MARSGPGVEIIMKLLHNRLSFLAVGTLFGCIICGASRAQDAPNGEAAPPGAVGASGNVAKAAPDPVVAQVGNQQIRQSELLDEIKSLPGGDGEVAYARLYSVALRRLVAREAIVIRARADGMTDDPDVERHMQEASDHVLEDAYLQRATAARVTEAALLARYQKEIAGKPGPMEVHGSAILLPTEAEATDIIAKLQGGADFATLARQFSKDASASKGGDIGFARRESLNPEVGAVLFALPPGTVTAYPVRTVAGWFVLKAETRRASPTPSFAQSRERLRAECQRDAIDAVVKNAVRQVSAQFSDLPISGGAANSPGSGDSDPNQ